MSWSDIKRDRDDDMASFWRWYWHPFKFWLDTVLHILMGATVAILPALAGAPWWVCTVTGLLGLLWREYEQWPPRRMPNGWRAWFDPPLDLLGGAVGGLLISFVPVVF